METEHSDDKNYKMILAEELAERQRRNGSYSLRAYARSLGVAVSLLSEVLNGRRSLSQPSAIKIANALALAPDASEQFLHSALGLPSAKKTGNTDRQGAAKQQLFTEYDNDSFKLISDWYHLAILSLAKIKPNRSSPLWIAERLGISSTEAAAAMSRLIRLKLISIKGRGFVRTTEPLLVRGGPPSAAIRKYHHQNLKNAAVSLDRDPTSIRDFSAVTVAADPAKIDAARELIQKCREEVSELLDAGRQTAVYTMAVQLFPVTTKGKGDT